ncbi:DMT family transporter [Aliamphritea spongicola]|uniref:DMT family transporter n=1 Tax=Aliamphritea spongicola TaxID=707589 RepID=UPI00196B2150|nr:DMT family transporter [Aliamphritea spongicola]MBN3563169.1 DMT family transporter [Aliamphritea spongicola]
MNTRLPVDGRAIGLMMLLCMTWGMQQVSIKLAADDMAAVLQICLRSGIAAVLLGLFMLWRKEQMNIADTWKPGLLAGFLFSSEFFLVGEGLRYTTASHISVFLYSAPVFAALGLHIKLPVERLSLLQWTGILLAFSGIAVTFLGRETATDTATADMIIGDMYGLMAGFCWGMTTVLIRCSTLSSTPASQTLMYQLLVCFVLLLGATLISGRIDIQWSDVAIGSLVFQGVIVCFISFLVWFWLLKEYVASQLGVFSFMTPMFGIVFGVVVLGEKLEQSFISGAVLVMSGIILVSGQSLIKKYLTNRRNQEISSTE